MHAHTRQIKGYLFQTLLPNADSVALYHIAHIPVITYSHKICRWDAFFSYRKEGILIRRQQEPKKKNNNNNAVFSFPVCTVPSHFYRSFRYFFKSTSCKMLRFTRRANFLMFSAAYLFMSRRQNAWFIVRLLGVAAREAVMLLLFSAACRAPLLFLSSPLYVHPDMHPQAARLSLFLLKLSSEVSEGLALLIPDTVNEKQEKTRSAPPRPPLLAPPCETV